uniref:ABI family, member 3 (NESH) binding protein a n=1 Tax=Dicentrarchus labrax TaxID=13489 RepID=A0A8C4D8W3_DICLA
MATVQVSQTNMEKLGGHPLRKQQKIPQSQPQPNPQLRPHYRPQPKPQTNKPKLKPKAKAKAQPQPKPFFEPESQPQPTSQPKHQTQPTSQPIPKSQPQPTSQPIPRTQPQPTSQPILQTQAQPQSSYQPILQTQPLPHSTSQPKLQTQPQPQPSSQLMPQKQLQPHPQPTSQSILQPKPQLQPRPKPHPQPQSQTTTQLQAEPQPLPTLQPKHQAQPQRQLHLKTQTQHQIRPDPQPTPVAHRQTPLPILQPKHQARPQIQLQLKTQTQHQIQPDPKPKPVAHRQTPQPTLKHIPQTQQTLPKIYIQPKPQPQPQSTTRPQTQTQPQLKIKPEPQLTTKQQYKVQPTPKPKINFFKPKTQPQPKSQPNPKARPQPNSQPKPQQPPQSKKQPKSQQKKQLSPQTRDKQPHQKIQPWPQSQPSTKTLSQPETHSQPISLPQPTQKTKTQSQLEPLSRPHPTSKPQPQPQPGLPFQSQTRTYSDPTKVTPRQAVPTAPSRPEEGKPLPRPALATENAGSYNQGTGIIRSSIAEVPRSPISSSVPSGGRNTTLSRSRVPPHSTHNRVRQISPSKTFTNSHSSSTPGVLRPSIPVNKKPNLVGKPSDHDKPMDLKQGDKDSILKPFPQVTAKPKQERRQQTTTSAPAVNSSRFDINENSSIFRPMPASEVDIMGKKRFVAPHVIYKTDKKPDEPCSITSSLSYFPDEEGSDQNVTGPPRIPPSNLTVVTVEGCPSFVILDWQKSDNETREYEVVSKTKGPHGEEVSILTTNQTHTAVENLQPESSYEFKVTPKNELGTGPSSDPVTFSTESADPRVSENVSGKDAIWTQFPFKSDAYSECNGKQYVKRTWYRKFVGIQLCNSLRYKVYLSDSLHGKFYNIGDQTGHGEDHCQFVDSFLDGRTGSQMMADQLPSRPGFYRAMRQEPVSFGEIGGKSHVTYVGWYECGTPIPGKW